MTTKEKKEEETKKEELYKSIDSLLEIKKINNGIVFIDFDETIATRVSSKSNIKWLYNPDMQRTYKSYFNDEYFYTFSTLQYREWLSEQSTSHYELVENNIINLIKAWKKADNQIFVISGLALTSEKEKILDVLGLTKANYYCTSIKEWLIESIIEKNKNVKDVIFIDNNTSTVNDVSSTLKLLKNISSQCYLYNYVENLLNEKGNVIQKELKIISTAIKEKDKK